MSARHRNTATAAIVAFALTACTSTLHMAGQPDIDGQVSGADDRHYYVENESGQIIAVPKRHVNDIDLPGNVLAIVGAVGLGLSLGGSPDRGVDEDMAVPLLTFAGMAAAGVILWWRAKDALSQPPPPMPALPFAPLQEVR